MKVPASLGDLPRPLYFFDGHCVLCSAFVAFCLARDPEGRLRFASTQSALGRRVLAALGLPDGTFDRTVLLLDADGAHLRSAAVLRALAYLKGPVRWLRPLGAIPAALRDPVYSIVARNRYRWFGRRTACLVPAESTRGRFIDL
ncbi:thiol-disulfide oxidoreductase DCC family protein [Reyranella sp.]|uniref:thiol-disulfide oxidoreductase DCC family protein n=1 Tax=Reyranella sp. TaxID=1929291 RepID=UPI003BAB0EBD